MGFCLFMMAHSCDTSLIFLVFFSFFSSSSDLGDLALLVVARGSSSSSSSSTSFSVVFSVQSEMGYEMLECLTRSFGRSSRY